MAIGRTLISGIRWSGVANIVQTLLNIAQVLILVRYVSKADFALVALAGIYFNLGAHLQDAGINAAIVRYQQVTTDQLSTLFFLNILTAFFLCVLAAPAGWIMAAIYHQPQLFPLSIFYCGGLFFYGFGVQFRAILDKNLSFRSMALTEMAGAIGGFLLTITLAFYSFGAWAIAGGYVLRYIMRSLGFIVAGRKYFRPHCIWNWQSIKPYLDFGRYHLAERLTTQVVSQIDILLVGKLLGADALGIYDVLKRILIRPSNLIALTFEKVTFPILSKLQKNSNLIRRVFLGILNAQCSLQFPLYFLAIAAGPWLIDIFLGPDWLPFLAEFRWLAAFVLLHAIVNPIDGLLLAANKIQWWWYANLLLGPFLILGIWAGHFGGLKGVIIAIILVYLLLILVSYQVLLKKLLSVSMVAYFREILLPFVISAAAMLPLWNQFMHIQGSSDWRVVGLSGIGFLLLYGVGSFFWNNGFYRQIKQALIS